MSKHFEAKLSQIQASITGLTQLATGQTASFNEYRSARIGLNALIIEAIFGATITGNKIKFNHPLPSIGEVSALVSAFGTFYENIEEPLLERFMAAAQSNPDSDDLPEFIAVGSIPQFNKIKVKDVKGAIIGDGSYAFPMVSMMFTPVQILEMAALSEDLRKVIHRNQILIIGGVTLAVAAAATVTGICIYNHNKHKDEAGVEDDVTDSIDDGGDVEDVPMVDLSLV